MAKLNVPRERIKTHEGATAKHINAEQQLRRSVMACLLWEKSFYENGEAVADRISRTIPLVSPDTVARMAVEAREEMNLRHVPLLMVREMARLPKHKGLVSSTLSRIIQRPDELSEFLAIYWKDRSGQEREPLSAQVKKGLSQAFSKFNEYQLAKYNRNGEVKLRDVLFLTHPKPKDPEQAAVWKRLADNSLATPDTWEVNLSTGEDKRETWERLMGENKLGGMALLRNLRNMEKVGVDKAAIRSALGSMRTDRILPYRFIAAANYAPKFEPELEEAMFRCLAQQPKLNGHTVLLVDVSGSMGSWLSSKSELSRIDAANGLAMLLREICEEIDIFTFSEHLVAVPPRRGFALRDAVDRSQAHMGTLLGRAVRAIYAAKGKPVTAGGERMPGLWRTNLPPFLGCGLSPDRLIVITDEQSHDPVPDPSGRGYMLNVGAYKNGVGYGPWTHIDGWSAACVRYIQEMEAFLDE